MAGKTYVGVVGESARSSDVWQGKNHVLRGRKDMKHTQQDYRINRRQSWRVCWQNKAQSALHPPNGEVLYAKWGLRYDNHPINYHAVMSVVFVE